MTDYKDYLKKEFNINEEVLDLVDKAENLLTERFDRIDDTTAI